MTTADKLAADICPEYGGVHLPDEEEGYCVACGKADAWHVGHWTMYGTYWCDTCRSPYCDLA